MVAGSACTGLTYERGTHTTEHITETSFGDLLPQSFTFAWEKPYTGLGGTTHRLQKQLSLYSELEKKSAGSSGSRLAYGDRVSRYSSPDDEESEAAAAATEAARARTAALRARTAALVERNEETSF